jgi:hypothetical protein
MDGRRDSVVSIVTRWSGWLLLYGGASCFSLIPDVNSSGAHPATCSVGTGFVYVVCIGGHVKIMCGGLFLEPYLHINAMNNYVLQCQLFTRHGRKITRTGY